MASSFSLRKTSTSSLSLVGIPILSYFPFTDYDIIDIGNHVEVLEATEQFVSNLEQAVSTIVSEPQQSLLQQVIVDVEAKQDERGDRWDDRNSPRGSGIGRSKQDYLFLIPNQSKT
jgi:hypothetical protein